MGNSLSGSMVALITPMKGGKVDFAGLEQLYRIHAAAGTDGVVVCGTTGESATLTHAEHEELIRHAADFFRDTLGEKSPLLVAGTGSNSTLEAVSLTHFAAFCKVDAVLVISPYYNKPTPTGQLIHFKEVAKAAESIPVILYNVPSRTGLKMNLPTILELSEVEGVAAIKEASGDLGLVSEIVRCTPPEFAVISGEDNLTFPMMALGSVGAISVTANIIPKQIKQMIDHCLEGDFKAARKIHQDQFTLTEALFAETSPIPVKTAINEMAGRVAAGDLNWPPAGEFRLPLCEMREDTHENLRNELAHRGLV